jgi:hypothetical protein
MIALLYFLSTIRLVIAIFSISYFVGMIWHAIIILTDQPDNFLTNFEIDSFEGTHYAITLMYFSFTTLSTVGFGDYYPYSDTEALISCLILLFGVAIFSYVLSELIQIIQTI